MDFVVFVMNLYSQDAAYRAGLDRSPHVELYGNRKRRGAVPSFDTFAGDSNGQGVVVGTMRAGGGFSNHHA